MPTVIMTTESPKPGPHAGWTPNELWTVLLLAGLIVMLVVVVIIKARTSPR